MLFLCPQFISLKKVTFSGKKEIVSWSYAVVVIYSVNKNFKLQWPQYNAYILYIIMYKNKEDLTNSLRQGSKTPWHATFICNGQTAKPYGVPLYHLFIPYLCIYFSVWTFLVLYSFGIFLWFSEN